MQRHPCEHGQSRAALSARAAALLAALSGGCSLLAPSDEELLGRHHPADAGNGGSGGDGHGDADWSPPSGGRDGGPRPGSGATPGSGGHVADASADGEADSGPLPVPPALGRLRLELHCGARTSGTSDSCYLVLPPTLPACPPEGYRPEVRMVLQGEPGATYTVTLHVRGVVEPKTYRNGQPVAGTGALENKGLFYAGGEPAGVAIYNSYGLDVSNPPQRYFVNNWVEGDYVLALDYRVALDVATGASVSIYGFTQRCQISYDCEDLANVVNCPFKALAGVEHLPDHGQFVQVDFVSAVRHAQATTATP
jgi:hypothetical protein